VVKAIEWKGDSVLILDQRLLPLEVRYIECREHNAIADAIRTLAIRGAPAIGIASAMAVALAALQQKASYFEGFYRAIKRVMDTMIATRHTAVNIQWAMRRMDTLLQSNHQLDIERLKAMVVEEALKIYQEDLEANKKIGEYGAQFIRDGASLNAKKQGKQFRVYADETRPVLQGARLTAWELMQNGIDVTLITDNSAGWLMRQGLIDLVIVGTDRTTLNGDVANKIGTYTVAVLSKEHGIPFYVAAPTSSIDFNMASGDRIPIEQRSPEEVTTIQGVRIAPEGVKALNFAFDVTPSRYVTAFLTEKGVFRPEELKGLAGGQ
jgi:methylthioribose-1-phosphate isomerase